MRRKEYDEELARETEIGKFALRLLVAVVVVECLLWATVKAKSRPSYALSIDLSQFTPSSPDEEEVEFYSHPCRCSGTYIISVAELEDGIEVIQCDGCSERCRVEYEVVED